MRVEDRLVIPSREAKDLKPEARNIVATSFRLQTWPLTVAAEGQHDRV
jgi:hypothetical protein